jgi:hypothetical protein
MAPIAPQTPAPTRAAWFFVIPVQPDRKNPTAANASCLFFFISASQHDEQKFWPNYYKVAVMSRKIFAFMRQFDPSCSVQINYLLGNSRLLYTTNSRPMFRTLI